MLFDWTFTKKQRGLGVLVKVATKCYGGTTLCHHLAVLTKTNECVLLVNLACYLFVLQNFQSKSWIYKSSVQRK